MRRLPVTCQMPTPINKNMLSLFYYILITVAHLYNFLEFRGTPEHSTSYVENPKNSDGDAHSVSHQHYDIDDRIIGKQRLK